MAAKQKTATQNLKDQTAFYTIKGASFIIQFFAILLLAEFLSTADLAEFFAITAFATIVISFTNFGYAQYAFRLICGKAKVAAVMTRVLEVGLFGLLIALPVGIFYSDFADHPVAWVFYALLASTLSRMIDFHRYLLIYQERIHRVFMAEGARPAVFLLLLIPGYYFLKSIGVPLTTFSALVLYLLSYILGVLGVIALSQSWREWGQAFQIIIKGQVTRHGIAAVWRSIKIAFPVGLESMLLIAYYNLPVLLSSNLGAESKATVLFGFLQRILSIVIGVVLVSTTTRFKGFYTEKYSRAGLKKLLRNAVLFGLFSLVGLFIWQGFSWLVGDALQGSRLFLLLDETLSYKLQIACLCAMVYAYFHLSYMALGADKKYLRVTTILIGVVVMVTLFLLYGFFVGSAGLFSVGTWFIVLAYGVCIIFYFISLWRGIYSHSG